ncbi:hypothetical protein [Herbaspirillum sp.]|uniref:hypothetical protein n=1 Tax=Herbaspirillum sp. TaxID=1890675 RepID=UPI000C0B51D8|nr:hypothetical protein [Herbaspirillum sp.]MAF04691.1 hypothetical protein [Herbaspirillum sp.]|tara:strand:+ start:11932 stop:12372 length:441 start_codon:yes stop_codon:yes gene_type:complete
MGALLVRMERDMQKTKQKSCIGSLVDGVLSIWGIFVIAGAVAMAIHISTTGFSFIPQWVLSVSGGLFVIAILAAIKKKSLKGLQTGAVMLVGTAFALGFSHLLTNGEIHNGATGQISVALTNLIVHVLPIASGLIAIAGAYLYTRD